MIVLWEHFSQKKKKFVYNITQMQLTVFQIKFYNSLGYNFWVGILTLNLLDSKSKKYQHKR